MPKILRSAALILAAVALPASAQTQPQTPPGMMPYKAILDPHFVPAAEAGFLQDDDTLIGVARGSVAKAYPAADLAQHGSVNDQMPDGAIEVTWCGVCNTGAVFRAKFKGRLLHFEYDSMVGANEVHKDHETGSRWQQSTGEAISGSLKGSRLELYPFVRTNWKEWRRRYPNTLVLEPLPGYREIMPNLSKRIRAATLSDEGEAPKGAFGHDARLRPKEVVAGLRVGAAEEAFPFSQLRSARVVNESVGGVPVLVVHQPSSDTTTAFEARAKGKVLQFQAADADASSLSDVQTHSSWNAYGHCLEGPLKGTQLKTLVLMPQFWFAWSEFHPQTKVFMASGGPTWETLIEKPVPAGTAPNIHIVSLRLAPAPMVPRTLGAGHTHEGPVFGYIVRGEIENQVEPDPAQIYKTGGFFYEIPGHVHRIMRNLSHSESALVIAFQVGYTGGAAPAIPVLAHEELVAMADQVVSLLRLTLPAGTSAEAPLHENPDAVYVLDGEVEAADSSGGRHRYGPGDLFVIPAKRPAVPFGNPSGGRSAKLLLYQVSGKPAEGVQP